MNQANALPWGRILVKLSGEVLLGGGDYGIDPAVLKRVASEIRDVQGLGIPGCDRDWRGQLVPAVPAWRAPVWTA